MWNPLIGTGPTKRGRSSIRVETERRRLEMGKEIARRMESRRIPAQSRPRTIERPPVVRPPQVIQPRPRIERDFRRRSQLGAIPGLIIMLIIGTLLTLFFIRLAAKVVVGYDLSYGEAFNMSLIVWLITTGTRFVAAFINEPAYYILTGISQLGIAPFVYGRMIDCGDGPIGFLKGLLIHICSIVAAVVIILGLAFAVSLVAL